MPTGKRAAEATINRAPAGGSDEHVLPTGTVTFLFASPNAPLFREQEPSEGRPGQAAEFESLLRALVETHSGSVFKAATEIQCAAFSTAHEALAAALAVQIALTARGSPAWRIALHTGSPEQRDGDYFGRPVNRVARLMAAAHGGQTVLSLATEELVRDLLPPNARLIDLGEHRLRDLERPERIFQLTHPDLPPHFPPLRTYDTHLSNLPAQRTPLVARATEAAALDRLLRRDDAGLVTLTGPGGAGKTRLALHAASDLLDQFPDGVVFVPLSTISQPGRVAPAIARELGLREDPDRPLEDTLLAHLRPRRALLVLDSLEHLAASVPLVTELLAVCPGLCILVTSRSPLRVAGEQEFPVPPLAVPDPRSLPPLADLERCPAVELFTQRAQAALPGFTLGEDNAEAVAEICARLDGLPLALELAASRIRHLPLPAMVARLEKRLDLLVRGARDLPPRQQTLRASIAWGYDLLTEPEQRLFRALSVFAGSTSLESILDFGSRLLEVRTAEVLDLLTALVDRSLVRKQGEDRFGMLETTGEFARERLEAAGEVGPARRAHAELLLTRG